MTTTEPDFTVLAPLARTIADTVQTTPINLGTPDGAAPLIQALILRTTAYMGSELPQTPGLAQHMVEVDTERQKQLAKWGDQHHPDGTAITGDDERAASARHVCQAMASLGQVSWRDILWEEIAEAFAEAEPVKLRAELVQCAAVIQAWISDIDSREA